MEQECIPVGCVRTVAVASTGCLYWGGGSPPGGRPLFCVGNCINFADVLIVIILFASIHNHVTTLSGIMIKMLFLELLPRTSSYSGLVVNSMPWAQGCMNTGSLAHDLWAT